MRASCRQPFGFARLSAILAILALLAILAILEGERIGAVRVGRAIA